jgi:hypothetical protein
MPVILEILAKVSEELTASFFIVEVSTLVNKLRMKIGVSGLGEDCPIRIEGLVEPRAGASIFL